jgi:bacterial/archaeal transporter family protein
VGILRLGGRGVLGLYDIWTKRAMMGNSVIPVVTWSSLFGAAFWLPAFFLTRTSFYVDVSQTSVIEQAILLPKSVAMTASWILAYFAVRELPVSIAGAVRASGPPWTLAGGALILQQFITPVQFAGLMITVVSYDVLSLIGKKEGIVLLRSAPILLMLLATILSAITTVYDRYVITHFNIPRLDIQVYSSIQRFVLSALVFLPYMLRSKKWGLGLTWSWAIPLVGLFWVVAELIYFLAVVDPGAMVAHLAVLRRTSLIISFVISAFLFKEANVPMKTVMIGVLIIGMAALILGK